MNPPWPLATVPENLYKLETSKTIKTPGPKLRNNKEGSNIYNIFYIYNKITILIYFNIYIKRTLGNNANTGKTGQFLKTTQDGFF